MNKRDKIIKKTMTLIEIAVSIAYIIPGILFISKGYGESDFTLIILGGAITIMGFILFPNLKKKKRIIG